MRAWAKKLMDAMHSSWYDCYQCLFMYIPSKSLDNGLSLEIHVEACTQLHNIVRIAIKEISSLYNVIQYNDRPCRSHVKLLY